MERFFKTTAGLVLLAIVGVVPGASASDSIASGPVKSVEGYYFCVALEDPTPAMSKGRALYTGVFKADGNEVNRFRGEYVKFAQEKYGYAQDPTTLDSSVQCVGTNSMEEASSVEQARMAPGKRLNPEGTVETGWTYSA